MSRWAPLVLSVAAILLFATLMMNPRPSVLVGDPAPELALPDFAQPATLVHQADLLGQPYLLSAWSSWCVSCRHQHPVLIEIARSERLKVIGYNYKDTPESAAYWLQRWGNPFQRIVVDVEGRTALDWNITRTPASFLIDDLGVVRWKHSGPITPEIVREDLWPLLAEIEAGR